MTQSQWGSTQKVVTWKSRGLEVKDYQIFLQLDRNPSQSNIAIAKEVGLSAEAVRIRRQALKKTRFLREDATIQDTILGERLQTETQAVYKPNNLGLLRQHVLFKDISSRKSLNTLKMLCDVHPYTHYRSVMYGKNATLYVQFDIPPAIRINMQTLYKKLLKKGLYESFEVIDEKYGASLKADFTRWNQDENSWTLAYQRKSSMSERTSKIEDLWDEFMKIRNKPRAEVLQPAMAYNFDSLDMLLLRELTINSRVSIKDLAEIYGKDASTISRRVARIRELVAPNDLLYYNYSVFDLTYAQIITGVFDKNSQLNDERFYQFIKSGVLPFECKGVTDGNRFLIYLHTPPSYASDFSEFFWEHADNVEVFQMQLGSSITYFFYHENYLGDGKWKTDTKYVLDEPLATIDK